MAQTTCLHCRSDVPETAAQCPKCGKPTGNVWGSCPECKGVITAEQESCKECGFPLRPTKRSMPSPASAPPAPQPPASRSKGTTGIRKRKRPKGRPILEPAEESPAAMMFAVVGLIVPLFAILALTQSRRGSPARRLAWVGIAIWVALMIFTITRAAHAPS